MEKKYYTWKLKTRVQHSSITHERANVNLTVVLSEPYLSSIKWV